MRYKTLSIRQLWDKTEEDPFKTTDYLDREVFAKLKKNLDSSKIDIIYGPRQSGKTTILMFLIDHLNDSGVDAHHIWYINLDLISDYSLFESAEKFLYLYDKSKVEGKLYLFIDEIQRLSTPGLFLKEKQCQAKFIKL